MILHTLTSGTSEKRILRSTSAENQSEGGGPLPEFESLTGGNPDAPVIYMTDPPGQYCNPRAEACDPSTWNPGSCMIDITTHGSICDYPSTTGGPAWRPYPVVDPITRRGC